MSKIMARMGGIVVVVAGEFGSVCVCVCVRLGRIICFGLFTSTLPYNEEDGGKEEFGFCL
jgi:hypothetical protein